jgi:AAA+ ATPase superfamily predicted ATPase
MPFTFVGRRKELELLEQAYRSSESAFIPIYGRRRVGKSELILRFLAAKRGLYYLGKQAPPALQRREFLRTAATLFREPLLETAPADGWKESLLMVTDRWKGPGKLIVVMDEFQWIAHSSPELPSVLQEMWDRLWKASGRIMLILCGSLVGFMERRVLGRKSPLFGRRTAQIFLKPFGYQEAALFHPAYSLPDRARAYFICGGVPLYLQCFNSGRSIERNIADNLLSEFAPLYHEPDFLLREELREVENYYAVLLAIATGYTTNQAVCRQTGIEARSLPYYLNQLIHLGYVIRRYPLTGRPPVARHVRYVLDDPLLRFWFRFVYPNTSFLSQMGAARMLQERVRPGLDAYYGSCFERLCREALPVWYTRTGATAAFEVGEYWDKAIQIDVVGLRDDGWTDLGECKWGGIPSARALQAELETKVRGYPNSRQASIGRHLFTRSRAPAGAPHRTDLTWHSLEDLYA